jgi:hypothetical protein
MTLGALTLALAASLALASGAQAQDQRFAKPVPGTLTVKVVIDGRSSKPGQMKGEKSEGTVHREANGSIYLDHTMVGHAGMGETSEARAVEAPGATPAPPNEMEEMGQAMEACKGDVQCMQAIAMKMQGREAGAGGEGEDQEAAPAAPAFLQRYVTWMAPGKSCLKGTAAAKEAYTHTWMDAGEGYSELEASNWTVSGSTPLPVPGTTEGLCNTAASVDTKAKTYDLRLDLSEVEIPVVDTKDGRNEKRKVGFGGELLIKSQPLPATGTTLTGTTRIPGVVEVWPYGKADAEVSWTFKPGR